MELDGLSVTEHSCGAGFSQYKTGTADCGLRTVDCGLWTGSAFYTSVRSPAVPLLY